MEDKELSEIKGIIEKFKVIAKTGERIESIPFMEPCDGFVYDDGLMRLAISDDGLYLEVFRKTSGTIVVDVSLGSIRRFSVDTYLLVPHLKSLTET